MADDDVARADLWIDRACGAHDIDHSAAFRHALKKRMQAGAAESFVVGGNHHVPASDVVIHQLLLHPQKDVLRAGRRVARWRTGGTDAGRSMGPACQWPTAGGRLSCRNGNRAGDRDIPPVDAAGMIEHEQIACRARQRGGTGQGARTDDGAVFGRRKRRRRQIEGITIARSCRDGRGSRQCNDQANQERANTDRRTDHGYQIFPCAVAGITVPILPIYLIRPCAASTPG
jgi:hypothetical protein